MFSFVATAREKNDKKLFSFAFVRLMEPGGATLQDGPHELYIYKCEDRSKLDSLSYLTLPSSAREPNAAGNDFIQQFVRSRESPSQIFHRLPFRFASVF